MLHVFFPGNSALKYLRDELYTLEDMIGKLVLSKAFQKSIQTEFQLILVGFWDYALDSVSYLELKYCTGFAFASRSSLKWDPKLSSIIENSPMF